MPRPPKEGARPARPARASGRAPEPEAAVPRRPTARRPTAAARDVPADAATTTRRGAAASAEPAALPPRAAPEARAAESAERLRRQASAAGAAAVDAAARASRRGLKGLQMTPTIVLTAASIIEEELASGLGAAKRIEQRFLDVEKLRSQSSDALMSKFRRDAHDAVDILLDVITAAATTVADRAGRMINVTASHASAPDAAERRPGAAAGTVQLATVRMPGRVAPGAVAELTVSLENDSDSATAEFTLHSSELMGSGGQRIAAAHVSFEPATLTVGPRSTGQVVVRVRVPAATAPGTYEGLLRASQLQSLRAMLHVQVG